MLGTIKKRQLEAAVFENLLLKLGVISLNPHAHAILYQL